ncbi:MAG: hypothetical protein ACPG7W_02685, partial [Paracoccaceae bacterium]
EGRRTRDLAADFAARGFAAAALAGAVGVGAGVREATGAGVPASGVVGPEAVGAGAALTAAGADAGFMLGLDAGWAATGFGATTSLEGADVCLRGTAATEANGIDTDALGDRVITRGAVIILGAEGAFCACPSDRALTAGAASCALVAALTGTIGTPIIMR